MIAPRWQRAFEGSSAGATTDARSCATYLRVHFGDVPEAERQRVRQALEQYCALDTEGMVEITGAVGKLAD